MTREETGVIDGDVARAGLVFSSGARALARVPMKMGLLARVGVIFLAKVRARTLDLKARDLAKGAIAREVG